MSLCLLDGRYAPITDAVGFLEANLPRVVAADTEWRASLGGYQGRAISGPLPSLLDALLPLTAPLLRYLWVETSGPWTAYFDNFVLGTDTFGPISFLAQRLGCRGVAVGCREGTARRGAAVSFSLYGPDPTDWLNVVRALSAVEDGGRWEWSAAGTPQPFEDTAAYGRRRVRDRLTPERLAGYCAALGIRPFDASFYGTAGHLVENTNITGSIRTETLAQTRAWHGLSDTG
jgi:hypothetical protein